MARDDRSDAQTVAPASDEWLTLAEARAILDVMSEDIVRIWAEKYGFLRSRTEPDGSLVVLKADVLYLKAVRDAHAAFPDEEITEEELETLRQARTGTYPWERERKTSSAA